MKASSIDLYFINRTKYKLMKRGSTPMFSNPALTLGAVQSIIYNTFWAYIWLMNYDHPSSDNRIMQMERYYESL